MTAISLTADEPNEPVKHKKRKHRIANLGQAQTYKVLFAHLGKFIVVGLYFFLLQTLHGQHTTLFHSGITLPDVKGVWDHLVTRSPAQGGVIRLIKQASWDPIRHVVYRTVLEGTLGFVLYAQIGFNVEKYRAKVEKNKAKGKDKLHWYNKFFASPYQNHPVTPLQYLFLPILLFGIVTFLGLPVFLAVHDGLAHAAHWTWLEPHVNDNSFVAKLWTGDYDGLLVGIVVGMVAGRSYKAYLYANTYNLGRSWVAKGYKAHWWMPQATRHLIADLCEEGVEHQQTVLAERHNAMKVLAPLGVTLAFALAIFGYFVLQTNGFTH